MFSDIAVSSMTTSRSSIDTLTCECEDGDAAVLAAFMGPVVAEYEKFDDAQKLIEGLNKTFNSVYAEAGAVAVEFSSLLGYTIDSPAVRTLLFDPEPTHALHYPILLAAASPRLQKILLSVVYLRHRKSWDFLKCFILADGLTALIPFLVDGNLYARGQAVELLLSVTDCDSYVWFRTGDDALLEHEALCYRLFRIIHHENFLKNLLQNRASSYPGGSYNCLQLIAFSLSWIRTKYSPTKKLRLHENIMDALRLWAQTDPGCHDHECADTSEELPEVKLAKTLCEDFGREPTISISENSFLFAFHGITTPGNFVDDSIPNKAISEMRALKAQRSQIDLRSAEELKEEGNKLYKVQNYVDAYKMFQLATNRLSKSDIASSLAITLWFNLATVNWKFAEICEENLLKNVVPELNCVCLDASLHSTHQCSSDENIWEARRLCHLRESETLSTKAIELSDSLHIKAIFRKASCLLALGSPKMAFEVADKAIESLKRDAGAATDLSGDVDSIALLKGVQRKCMAAVLTNDEHLLQTAASLDAVTLNSNGEVVSSSVAASEVVLSGLSQLATSEHSAMPMSASTASILLKLRARASHSDAISTHPSSSAPVAEGQLSDAVVPSAINEPLAGASHSLDRSTLSGAPKHPSKTSFSVAAPSTVMKPRVTGKKVKDLTAKNAALERASVLKKHLKSLKSELSKDSCSIDGIKSLLSSFATSHLSLADVIGEGLDESMLSALLRVAIASPVVGGGDPEFLRKYLAELTRCSRFETQLRFMAFGNNALQDAMLSLLESLPHQEGLEIFLSVFCK